jgi:hypothetical protein
MTSRRYPRIVTVRMQADSGTKGQVGHTILPAEMGSLAEAKLSITKSRLRIRENLLMGDLRSTHGT